MQLKSYHEQCLEPSQAVIAQPPSKTWPCGRYNVVIVNVDPTFKWPHSHLEGHCVGHLCLIFRPITPLEYSGTYLAYVEHLNWLPHTLLPDILDERLLSYLKTDDSWHLYDVACKCWNPAFLPPLLCQPDHRKGEKEKKKASLDEEEEVESDKTAGVKSQNDEEMLADFFNRIMKVIPITIEELC
ncbi:hypothetical protein BDR07DRAFT_1476379 [Suillus spraguei]|nr:hypothetical protein BDR07DRAFT_1476379 [Suillus spraguei]